MLACREWTFRSIRNKLLYKIRLKTISFDCDNTSNCVWYFFLSLSLILPSCWSSLRINSFSEFISKSFVTQVLRTSDSPPAMWSSSIVCCGVICDIDFANIFLKFYISSQNMKFAVGHIHFSSDAWCDKLFMNDDDDDVAFGNDDIRYNCYFTHINCVWINISIISWEHILMFRW